MKFEINVLGIKAKRRMSKDFFPFPFRFKMAAICGSFFAVTAVDRGLLHRTISWYGFWNCNYHIKADRRVSGSQNTQCELSAQHLPQEQALKHHISVTRSVEEEQPSPTYLRDNDSQSCPYINTECHHHHYPRDAACYVSIDHTTGLYKAYVCLCTLLLCLDDLHYSLSEASSGAAVL